MGAPNTPGGGIPKAVFLEIQNPLTYKNLEN